MKEIDAAQWHVIGGGRSWTGAAPGWHRRNRAEPYPEPARAVAGLVTGQGAATAPLDRPGAESAATAEGGSAGMRESLGLPIAGRQPGLLMIELPEQDKLGLE